MFVLPSLSRPARKSRKVAADIRVSLVTFFDPVQSATNGEVEVQIQRTGSDGNIFMSSDLIQAEVRLLVIGI
jgi:hypothetical protein